MDFNINLNVSGRIDLVVVGERLEVRGESREASAPAQPQPKAEPEPEPEQKAQPQPQPKPEPKPEPGDLKGAVIAAMAEVRCRIEGSDWETNTDSDGYRKYHRKLNGLFRTTAMRIAGCKPTEIADPFKVRLFCEACSFMRVGDDGEVTEDKSVKTMCERAGVDEPDDIDLPF